MRKNGFTLIELLAVIVILAIIALIATPIILNIINSTKEESNKRSIELYAEAVEEAVARHQMNNNKSVIGEFLTVGGTDGKQIQQGETTLKIDYDGKVICKTVKINKDGSIILISCDVNGEATNYSYGIPTPVSFENDDWSTIIANVQAGNTDAYNVGDEKEIELTGYNSDLSYGNITAGTYTVRIANKSNDDTVCTSETNEAGETYSKTACGFVIEFVDIITTYPMNPSTTDFPYGTNVGGWRDSEMRSYVNRIIYNSFPEEIKDNIIPTTVASGHGSTSGETNFVTTDKLYLLSKAEIWKNGTSNLIINDTVRDVTRQLDYYQNYKNTDGSIGVTTNNYSGAIKKYNDSAYYWWLRSADSLATDDFSLVGDDGENLDDRAKGNNGVDVAFRLSE